MLVPGSVKDPVFKKVRGRVIEKMFDAKLWPLRIYAQRCASSIQVYTLVHVCMHTCMHGCTHTTHTREQELGMVAHGRLKQEAQELGLY